MTTHTDRGAGWIEKDGVWHFYMPTKTVSLCGKAEGTKALRAPHTGQRGPWDCSECTDILARTNVKLSRR